MYTSGLANTEFLADLVQLLGPLAAATGAADCLAYPLLGDADGRESSLDDVAEAATFFQPLANDF